ncbi:MAG TPA: GNAT family N-acetyltransferase [Pseudorhizobium sp.]|jgi:GNAT superfamily N-acetyltransferase|nr:GNAT family N-acetyltransferase [Pseudorhizobium sp.]
MDARYSLIPTVEKETDPVTLIVHRTEDTHEQLELLLAVEGAKTLKLVPGRDLNGAKIMMRAGASFSRHSGVRLSNGFNVVDPSAWHRQGIGTVALNLMIEWAKRLHPDADVRPVELKRYKQDIEGDDPRLAFYRRFNLQWNLADQDQDAVNLLSVPMTVRDLQTAPLSARLTRLP